MLSQIYHATGARELDNFIKSYLPWQNKSDLQLIVTFTGKILLPNHVKIIIKRRNITLNVTSKRNVILLFFISVPREILLAKHLLR